MAIKKRFTMWYIRRGYIFDPETGFECPFWVKPLLIFFSPIVYTYYVFGEWVYKNFMEGMKGGKNGYQRSRKLPEVYVVSQ